jgi:hypothetical protein
MLLASSANEVQRSNGAIGRPSEILRARRFDWRTGQMARHGSRSPSVSS